MKQKQQAFRLLTQFFNCPQSDFELTILKNIGSKKYVFSPGDQISSIYFVMDGDVSLTFQNADIAIPSPTIIGDFQISKQLTRRASSFRAVTRAKIIILPKDFYFKIRPQIRQKQNFVPKYLISDNQKLVYLISKCFVQKNVDRGQWVLPVNNQEEGDIIVIRSGIFSIKKYIGVGVIKKHKIEVQKQFVLITVSQGEVLKQNISCDSHKGEVFICKHFYSKKLTENFPQFQQIFEINRSDKKQSRFEREKSIKKICIPNCELYDSLLPSVFHSERKEEKSDRLKRIMKTEPTEILDREQFEKNHYEIKRQLNNNLFSKPTNSNFSLVPEVRIRKPSIPLTVRLPRTAVLQKYFKNKMGKGQRQNEQLKEKRETNQCEIPDLFYNKFEKKMFLKPTNPFHHHKKRYISLDPQVKDHKKLRESDLCAQNRNYMSVNKKLKKSFLIVSDGLV